MFQREVTSMVRAGTWHLHPSTTSRLRRGSLNVALGRRWLTSPAFRHSASVWNEHAAGKWQQSREAVQCLVRRQQSEKKGKELKERKWLEMKRGHNRWSKIPEEVAGTSERKLSPNRTENSYSLQVWAWSDLFPPRWSQRPAHPLSFAAHLLRVGCWAPSCRDVCDEHTVCPQRGVGAGRPEEIRATECSERSGVRGGAVWGFGAQLPQPGSPCLTQLCWRLAVWPPCASVPSSGKGENMSTHLIGRFWALNEGKRVKPLAQCLSRRKYEMKVRC